VDFVNANLNDPEISEDLFGAALLVVSECKRRFDSDGVLRLFEENDFSPQSSGVLMPTMFRQTILLRNK
jgi:hypothetical protein